MVLAVRMNVCRQTLVLLAGTLSTATGKLPLGHFGQSWQRPPCRPNLAHVPKPTLLLRILDASCVKSERSVSRRRRSISTLDSLWFNIRFHTDNHDSQFRVLAVLERLIVPSVQMFKCFSTRFPLQLRQITRYTPHIPSNIKN